MYRSMIGTLLYLTTTRLDILQAMCIVARFQTDSKEVHVQAMKRIFRYLKDTQEFGLWYPTCMNFTLFAYLDVD